MLPEQTRKGLAAWRAYKKYRVGCSVIYRDELGIHFADGWSGVRVIGELKWYKVKRTGM